MAGVFTLLPVELSLCWGVAGAVWAGAPGFVHLGSMLAVGEQLELSDVFIQHESFLSLPAYSPGCGALPSGSPEDSTLRSSSGVSF